MNKCGQDSEHKEMIFFQSEFHSILFLHRLSLPPPMHCESVIKFWDCKVTLWLFYLGSIKGLL